MSLRIISIVMLFFMACKGPDISSHSDNEGYYGVTPQPFKINKKQGYFEVKKNTSITYNNASSSTVVNFFIAKINTVTGYNLVVSDQTNQKNNIEFIIDSAQEFLNEEYHLSISNDKISIKAGNDKGLFYGMQTVLQLVSIPANNTSFHIPALDIEDKPRFSWRGMHLDVSRHFFSIDFIKKQLDILALFKINKFHWHLTDDQGWRIEIKKYPKLTDIGSKRINPDGTSYQGYYTQEEIKEVVQYAKERFIDVIPEFDTPGHTMAVLAGYPELSCHPENYKVRNLWGVESNILCAGKEETYVFIEDVVKELSELFPYEYYHMGGDEVPKEEWKNSTACQELKKKEGLKDEKEIQSYFMARVEKILKKYNKKMIGWDEILEGGITPTTNIMSWQGEEGGIKAANEGHDVIMTPVEYVYLNFYQGDHKVEPLAFGGYTPLEKVYNYDPIPSAIKKDKQKHILGAQGNLWSEHAYDEETAEYLLYPRIIAIAETTWTSLENKNYEDFITRLDGVYNILDSKDVNYHIPLPEGPTSNKIVFVDSVTVPFTSTRPIKMIYTTDGKDPSVESKTYTEPLLFKETTDLRIASVLDNGKISAVRKLQIIKEEPIKPQGISAKSNGLIMKEVKGYFQNVSEIQNNKTANTIVLKNIKDANTTYHWGHEIMEDNFKAVFLDGYLDIPEDGVYYFSSAQDQVWIADQLLIDYKTPLKKHPIESSIALKKGKHKLKIVYLNNVYKGWATDWNTVELKYRKASDTDYQVVDETMIFH
ncbi:family 20 glycosylhydrolase [Aquimarina sp. 2201CG5-10]|uniref:family 20 glycosylhydrolase n=1 Tax=Aquimarina callyspongiae TaxID=3098150 RepID=UPI002AB4DBB9|nr:family 20 glycosylhydrolase [Aquimarina sp. 2201CG5-10]MDY8135141.1 family 20 glycosylhydrolase [Aquimarina sp. 2201CG5-10]